MPLTPQITLKVTLLDYSGATIGTATQPAYVRISLVGYRQVLPCIPGTGNIAKVASWSAGDIPFVGSLLTILLWGNDVIAPANTYYCIAVLDANKNVLQSGNYQFTGTQTIDLSSAPQIIPTPPTPPGWLPWIFVTSVAGVLTIPASAGRNFWTILHEDVTSVVVSSPTLGQDYWFFFEQDGTGDWTVAWGAALLNPIDPVNPVATGFTLQPAKCLPTGQLMNTGYYP